MTDRCFLSRLDSPTGELLLVCDADGRLRALDWSDYEPRLKKLLQRFSGSGIVLEEADPPPACRDALAAYFDGRLDALDTLSVATQGSEFQQRIWQLLRTIPAGETRSYGALAQAIHKPGAARAVGLANGSNPVAIVVPCHRVIGADGSLTGYGGGVDRKRWLLEHERATGFSQQASLF